MSQRSTALAVAVLCLIWMGGSEYLAHNPAQAKSVTPSAVYHPSQEPAAYRLAQALPDTDPVEPSPEPEPYAPPEGTTLYVFSEPGTLNLSHTIEMPLAMATEARDMFLGCEAKPWRKAHLPGPEQPEATDPEVLPYPNPANAIGAAGELGGGQLHPIHFESMVRQGLNPQSEHDRLLFEIGMWQHSGANPWSCKSMIGVIP